MDAKEAETTLVLPRNTVRAFTKMYFRTETVPFTVTSFAGEVAEPTIMDPPPLVVPKTTSLVIMSNVASGS